MENEKGTFEKMGMFQIGEKKKNLNIEQRGLKTIVKCIQLNRHFVAASLKTLSESDTNI